MLKLEAFEVKTEVRFGLSGPSYLLGPALEAPLKQQLDPKSLIKPKPKKTQNQPSEIW